MKERSLSYKNKTFKNRFFTRTALQLETEDSLNKNDQRLFFTRTVSGNNILSRKQNNKDSTLGLEIERNRISFRNNLFCCFHNSTGSLIPSERSLGDLLEKRGDGTSLIGFKSLIKTIPKYIKYAVFSHDENTIYTVPSDLLKISSFLRDHIFTQYKILIDVTAVDSPSQPLRFKLVYNLLSIKQNSRIRVETCIDQVTPVQSLTQLFSSAGWWEREVWDMFGIFFSHHPDLRRILTDYGFQGHPLRKDFPLSGYVQVRYDDTEKKVITEPLEVAQEFRYFDFASPWQQLQKST